LVCLINDLRPDLPEIRSVEILNPGIHPEELRGKYIVLDVLARDEAGRGYDIEIQVRRYGAWHQRGLYYLARVKGTDLFSPTSPQATAASGVSRTRMRLSAVTGSIA
jgi:predicted transposase/invertase (TIGR01784 family)